MICAIKLSTMFKAAIEDSSHSSALGSPLSDLIGYAYANNPTKYALTNVRSVVGQITRCWGRKFSKEQLAAMTRDILTNEGYDLAPKQGSTASNEDFIASYLAKCSV